MKHFLGIDVTLDKENEKFDGDEFIIQKPSAYLAQQLQENSEEFFESLEKAKLPLFLRILQWVCGLGALIGGCALVRVVAEDEEATFGLVYQNAPWIFWLLAAMAIIWLALYLCAHRKFKQTMENPEQEAKDAENNALYAAIQRELGVPMDAGEAEVLSFHYKMKGEEMHFADSEMGEIEFNNLTYSIFADEENLYLADGECKYAFPKSSMKRIQTVKKRGYIFLWMKDEKPNKGIYKPYKLSVDKYENVHFKTYHILEVEKDGVLWGIYFPCYELPIFEEMTGLKAE